LGHHLNEVIADLLLLFMLL